MLRHITEALIAADPAHATEFRNNQAIYLQAIGSAPARSYRIGSSKLPIVASSPTIQPGPISQGDLASTWLRNHSNAIRHRSHRPFSCNSDRQDQKEQIKVMVSEIQLSQKIPELLAKETRRTSRRLDHAYREAYQGPRPTSTCSAIMCSNWPTPWSPRSSRSGRFPVGRKERRVSCQHSHSLSFGLITPRSDFPGVIALKDISLSINAGEFVGVIGPNGSGKTTLCRAVLGSHGSRSKATSIFLIVPAMNCVATTAPRSDIFRKKASWIAIFP